MRQIIQDGSLVNIFLREVENSLGLLLLVGNKFVLSQQLKLFVPDSFAKCLFGLIRKIQIGPSFPIRQEYCRQLFAICVEGNFLANRALCPHRINYIVYKNHSKMRDPFNYSFPTRDQTMYLSTINKQEPATYQSYSRQSSFLRNDIDGSKPRPLVTKYPKSNFSLSSFVQPIPNTTKFVDKRSNPLYIDDIEGARPKATTFTTNRNTNPLYPKYVLPSASQIMMDKGRQFIRDTLNIEDINGKKASDKFNRAKPYVKQAIEGSRPANLTRSLKAKSRLQVKDINKDGSFETSRYVNPLEPTYVWRDNEKYHLTKSYGVIEGTKPMKLCKDVVNRPNNYCLHIKDIQGTAASSMNYKRNFIDKRKQFRNYMETRDIDKSFASSLKKGITTNRQTNPLMPAYRYIGSSMNNNIN